VAEVDDRAASAHAVAGQLVAATEMNLIALVRKAALEIWLDGKGPSFRMPGPVRELGVGFYPRCQRLDAGEFLSGVLAHLRLGRAYALEAAVR
jgi:hypothetical protein